MTKPLLNKELVLWSPFPIKKIIQILKSQVDEQPRLWRIIISLNVSRYTGTSRVCGNVFYRDFELRNRKDPYLSLRAKGRLFRNKTGTTIKITWENPNIFFSLISMALRKFRYDKEVILCFLKEWIKAEEVKGEMN